MQSTLAMREPDELEVVQVGESEDELWDDYVRSHPDSSFYHLSGWRRAITSTFARRVLYLRVKSGDKTRGVLPLVRLKSLAFGDFLVSVEFLPDSFSHCNLLNQIIHIMLAILARQVSVFRCQVSGLSKPRGHTLVNTQFKIELQNF